MTVSFNIEYRTSWGEEVRIAGLLPESIPMHTTDGIYWTADVELEVPKEGMTINYSYQIEQNQIIIRKEWDSFPRRLFLSGNSKKNPHSFQKKKHNYNYKGYPASCRIAFSITSGPHHNISAKLHTSDLLPSSAGHTSDIRAPSSGRYHSPA